MLSKDEAAQLDEAVFAADRAARQAKDAQRDKLMNMSPAEYEAAKRKLIDDAAFEAKQRRDRAVWGR